MVEVLRSGYCIPSIISHLWCRNLRVSFLHFRVCEVLGTSRSGQDAGKRCFGRASWDMETGDQPFITQQVLDSFRKEDIMFLLDLKDSYFWILILLDYHPYLWIALNRKVFQFKALCFSLSTAPQVFTKVLFFVSEWVRRRGIRLLHYLGYKLVVEKPILHLLEHHKLLLHLCQNLGIVVNWEKSDLKLTYKA